MIYGYIMMARLCRKVIQIHTYSLKDKLLMEISYNLILISINFYVNSERLIIKVFTLQFRKKRS